MKKFYVAVLLVISMYVGAIAEPVDAVYYNPSRRGSYVDLKVYSTLNVGYDLIIGNNQTNTPVNNGSGYVKTTVLTSNLPVDSNIDLSMSRLGVENNAVGTSNPNEPLATLQSDRAISMKNTRFILKNGSKLKIHPAYTSTALNFYQTNRTSSLGTIVATNNVKTRMYGSELVLAESTTPSSDKKMFTVGQQKSGLKVYKHTRTNGSLGHNLSQLSSSNNALLKLGQISIQTLTSADSKCRPDGTGFSLGWIERMAKPGGSTSSVLSKYKVLGCKPGTAPHVATYHWETEYEDMGQCGYTTDYTYTCSDGTSKSGVYNFSERCDRAADVGKTCSGDYCNGPLERFSAECVYN